MNIAKKKTSAVLRRVLAFALAALMVLSLCACGSSKASAAPAPTPAPTPVPTPEPTPEPTEEPFIGERYVDEDGDGIIKFEFTYKGATVYALAVLDPSRVFTGVAIPDPTIRYGYGIKLDSMMEYYHAVGGMNAGIFLDEGGTGSGWPPLGITYSEGVNYVTEEVGPVAGIDVENKLWAGYYSIDDCEGLRIRDGVSFGPVLIMDGEKAAPETLEIGVGARSAIGQRADGTIIMMVADGRQGYSIGLSFQDCVDLLYDKFECINAVNMDGGNSSCIAYNGQLLDNPSNKSGGTRELPDAWLIRELPAGYTVPEGVPTELRFPLYTFEANTENRTECSLDVSAGLEVFAPVFLEAYYGYFGTKNSDYYYPTLLQYVAEDSDLRSRMDMALMDRLWVNTWNNELLNGTVQGTYDNGDGTYTIVYNLDIIEHSDFWTYEHPNTTVEIIVREAPETAYGYLAVATK